MATAVAPSPCRRAGSRRSAPRSRTDCRSALGRDVFATRASRPSALLQQPEDDMSKDNQWIAGINAVAAAVEHDAGNVREVLLEAGAKNPRIAEIETSARRKDIDVRRVAQNALDGVAGGLRHQGAVARYAAAKTWDEDALPGLIEAAQGKALLLVLDGVQDPHNLGATVRKTSAGAADSVPVVRVTNLSRTMREVQKLGVWIYGLAGDAQASVYALDLRGNVALVLGGEADGLRRLTREQCDQLVTIPMP